MFQSPPTSHCRYTWLPLQIQAKLCRTNRSPGLASLEGWTFSSSSDRSADSQQFSTAMPLQEAAREPRFLPCGPSRAGQKVSVLVKVFLYNCLKNAGPKKREYLHVTKP